MRIDPTTIVSINDTRPRPGNPGRPDGSPSSVVSLGEAAAAAQVHGDVDPSITTRIARIREELAAGTYVVDLEKLSERILDDDLAREGR